MSTWHKWCVLGLLGLACTACSVSPTGDTSAAMPGAYPLQQSAMVLTQHLLHDLRTYCYACHSGSTGQTFDPVSQQPAFFAATSEPEVLDNVRQIAGRAIRYLRSGQMPKATDPLLPKDKRRQLIKALKLLRMSPVLPAVVPDPAQVAQLRATYNSQLRSSLTHKCGVCHGQEANLLQALVFGGSIRLARQAWDSADGFSFDGGPEENVLAQLRWLEVAVMTQAMPPRYYTASFPERRLSPDEIARLRSWIIRARRVYGQSGAPTEARRP